MRQHLRELIGFTAIFVALSLFLTSFVLAAGDDAAGQKLFESKCSQCHGKDAKGSAKMAKVLKVDPAAVDLTGEAASKLKAEEMELTVTNGKKKMPKFKGKLTAEQIQSVIKFVKSLQGASPSAK